MKKYALILALVLALGCLGLAHAEEYTSGDFEYILLEDGTAEITDYTGEADALKIPAELDGYPVTAIGDEAFYNCRSLASVTIPDSVVSMGANPFTRCHQLTEIRVSPDHPVLATIDGVLFDKTEKKLMCYPDAFTADSYAIPQGILAIGDYAFYVCDSLASVTIPDSVTSIGDYAFYDCDSLTSVTIPEGVTSIGDYAFSRCDSLDSVTIPDSVTSIGEGAFYDCVSLDSVTIPDSVASMGVNPFAYCGQLTDIRVSPDHPVLATIDGVLFDKTEKKLICYPFAYEADSYAIPQGILAIGDYAFYDCRPLASVTIPDSVTSIGDFAFSGCSSLDSVTIPESVTSIGDYAFYYCASLASVTIPEGVTSIGDWAFYDCASLASVTIPDSITSIGESAFYRCSSLASVTIPEGVTSIGDKAFWSCDSLLSITIPDSVTSIGDDAFYGCPDTLTLTVERGSHAAEYAKAKDISYTYPDANDWLNS